MVKVNNVFQSTSWIIVHSTLPFFYYFFYATTAWLITQYPEYIYSFLSTLIGLWNEYVQRKVKGL